MRAMRERAFSGRNVSILRHDRGVTGIGRRCVKVERRAQAKEENPRKNSCLREYSARFYLYHRLLAVGSNLLEYL